jgi:hypothetical protein
LYLDTKDIVINNIEGIRNLLKWDQLKKSL